MIVLPIPTPLLKPGDNLVKMIAAEILPGDIVVISSKAVSTVEGNFVDLSALAASDEALSLAKRTGREAPFMQAALEELKRLRGKVLNAVPGAVLTEVKPDGFPEGSILTANAGLDESNAPKGFAVGWPLEPVMSVKKMRKELIELIRTRKTEKMEREKMNPSSLSFASSLSSIGVILSDSCCHPRRLGVTAFALAVAGLDPHASQKGKQDLFGKPLGITVEAVADQLATAANAVMGNAGQSVPAAIIREHGISFTDFSGWVPGMKKDKDLFGGVPHP